MQLSHLCILLFTLLANLLYCICQEEGLNDLENSNSCQPDALLQFDFCKCTCSEVTAALRSSPALQVEASRRLKLRQQKKQKGKNEKNKYTVQPYTPGLLKCWEDSCVDSQETTVATTTVETTTVETTTVAATTGSVTGQTSNSI
ncbi:uncharacterized protein LOC125236177 [Leguminivora glycinivorella]|uniref:uncharacterized protein LOC125236177 n=1 Tax=Leguminivora glycinivorella TaxID=1035111 RepID=UPI00200C3C84|nr:uncharacterized protein LOC125236177 [Leguminivora glycinivorella]